MDVFAPGLIFAYRENRVWPVRVSYAHGLDFLKYHWARPRPGTYHIRARAIDGQGGVEGYGPRGSYPEGATGQQVLKLQIV